jgi:hypothetical protein
MPKNTEFPIEAYTSLLDYLKHISSLSTGSILLIVAFLEKLFVNPEWKVCIGISLISFVITIIATLVAQAFVVEYIDYKMASLKIRGCAGFSILCMWGFFLIGLISLVAFALKNLY